MQTIKQAGAFLLDMLAAAVLIAIVLAFIGGLS